MHLLVTRVIGIRFLPVVIYLATLVTASGAAAIHLRVGHSVFLPGFYLPLQLFFFFKAFKTGEWKFICLSGATLALMIVNGGTHILPMSFAAIGTFAVCAAIARRDWRPLALALAFSVAGLAYAAPKLLPVVEFVGGEQFWDTRNPTEKPDRVTVEILKQAYLVPTQQVSNRLPMQRHGWHEYGNYIGAGSALALTLGLIGVLVRRSRTDQWFGVSLALTTVVLFLLSLGEFSAWSPAVLSQRLPLFSSFRIPSRYTIPFLQFAALTLAWTFQSVVSRSALSRNVKVALTVLAFGASAHLILTNQWNLKNVFNQPSFDTRFRWMSGPNQISTDADSSPYTGGSPMLRALMEDRAFYACYESLQLVRSAGAGPQVVDRSSSARVSDLEFTPNRFTFSVKDGADPAIVVLNQNWSPGWSTNAGPMSVGKPTEATTVTLPAGTSGRYTFTFMPPGLMAGSGIGLLALIVTALTWRRGLSPILSGPESKARPPQ
jgi:hypothetical protein